MTYHISEIFTGVIQGEGMHVGRPCHFLRFSHCNLWSDPAKKSLTCPWCDTPQLHDVTEVSFDRLKHELESLKLLNPNHGLVISGGEPFLQLDGKLVDYASSLFPWIDVETNGTLQAMFNKPRNVFFSCSPKVSMLKLINVDWYKLLIPDKEHLLQSVLERAAFENAFVYVQPVEIGGYQSAITKENIRKCMSICNKYGTIRLSLQTHKIIGIR